MFRRKLAKEGFFLSLITRLMGVSRITRHMVAYGVKWQQKYSRCDSEDERERVREGDWGRKRERKKEPQRKKEKSMLYAYRKWSRKKRGRKRKNLQNATVIQWKVSSNIGYISKILTGCIEKMAHLNTAALRSFKFLRIYRRSLNF